MVGRSTRWSGGAEDSREAQRWSAGTGALEHGGEVGSVVTHTPMGHSRSQDGRRKQVDKW